MGPGVTPEQALFCQQAQALASMVNVNTAVLNVANQQNTALLNGVPIQSGQTLLSGMPVPSPVSHAKRQADARIAELEAKLAAVEAELAEREAAVAAQGAVISLLTQPAAVVQEPSPIANALAAWSGRGGVDQWSGMPLSVGRWVK